MATTTPNLGLTKPAGTDKPEITVINENMDKIDAAVAGIEIGGRNIFLGTKDFSVGVIYATGVVDLTNKIGGFTILKAKCPSEWPYHDPFQQKLEFEPNTQYTLSFYAKADSTCIVSSFFYDIGNEGTYNDGRTPNVIGTEWKKYVITWTTGDTARLASVIPIRLQDTKDVWVYMYAVKFEKGNKSTDWTPALEDVDNSIIELSMLGWSVPKECPVQNEVNGNQFVQKVGRVDLGSLEYVEHVAYGVFTEGVRSSIKIHLDTGTTSSSIYCKGYLPVSWDVLVGAGKTDTNHIADNGEGIIGFNTTLSKEQFQSAMQCQYLYYELATPITTTIDGNEIGETVSDVRKETTVNLLKPTLETTTINGITCTNNGDGTYTLNGTASSLATFVLLPWSKFRSGKYRLTGCPKNGSEQTYFIECNVPKDAGKNLYQNEYGDGNTITVSDVDADNIVLRIIINENVTVNNLVFKPMLTTNLSATIDDFVPYTGDSGRLNGDVAEIQENMATIELGTDITD